MKKSVVLSCLVLTALLVAGCNLPSFDQAADALAVSPPPVRTAAIIVAAPNASAADKARADYLSLGDGHDEVIIQKAVDTLPAQGERSLLLSGSFIIGHPGGINLPSNTTVIINGLISLAGELDADACLFTNSDRVYGNRGINIIDGTLNGNEKNNPDGKQYAINFIKVSDSKVDCWIENFRTADELMVDCQVNYRNRNYDDAYSPRTKYLSRAETTRDFVPSPNLELNSKDFFEGQNSLQITAKSNQANDFMTSAKFDLRFNPMIVMKYKMIFGTTQHFWAYLYNPRLDSYVPLHIYKYADDSPNRWKLALMDISAVDWTALDAAPSDFLSDVQFRIKLDGREEGENIQILIDDIYAIRGLNQAIITLVFDDGFASDFTQGAYMHQYGYKGVSGIISTAVGSNRYMTAGQLGDLYKSGWDIVNHSYSHIQAILPDGEQWIQDTAGRAYLESLGFSRSAKYRLYVGNQSELSETDSRKISSARRFMGTPDVNSPSASLPYGYTQQLLNDFSYTKSGGDAQTKVSIAKKFHTWQLLSCHEITDEFAGAYKTPIKEYQGLVDYIHASGVPVKVLSEVYRDYPPGPEPVIDFSMQDYSLQFHNLRAADPTYICANQDLSGPLPVNVMINQQPDVSRNITWAFKNQANITAFSLVISGIDAKGIPHTIKVTDNDGWSGETSRDLSNVSIQMTARTGTGEGNSLQIGIGSNIGLPGKIYDTSDVIWIKKNNTAYPDDSYRVNEYYDTIDLFELREHTEGDDFEIQYRSNLNHFNK